MAEVCLPPPRHCRFLRPQPMTRTRSGPGGQRSRGPASPPEKRRRSGNRRREGERKAWENKHRRTKDESKRGGSVEGGEEERLGESAGGEQKKQSHGVRSQIEQRLLENICEDSVAEASWQHQEVIQTSSQSIQQPVILLRQT